jgi:hypothetical protein
MKGYRTPSWFRAKIRLKQKQVTAQRIKSKDHKLLKGKR